MSSASFAAQALALARAKSVASTVVEIRTRFMPQTVARLELRYGKFLAVSDTTISDADVLGLIDSIRR